MLSCEVQLTRLAAGNFDHRFASCCFAFCSSFTQLLTDWSAERPAVAATSSLQLRAMSNFGTPSATGMTSCEPNTIIEIEIGIFRPPPDLARQYRSGSFPGRQYYLDAAAPFHARPHRSTDRRSIPFSPCGRRCLREAKADEGSFSAEKNPSPALSYKGPTRGEGKNYASLLPSWRLASNRNQVRRSVSSMKTSSRLAVPESSCSSQSLCAFRIAAA